MVPVIKKLLTNENLKYMGQGWLIWGKGDKQGTGMEQILLVYVHSLRKKCKPDWVAFCL